MAGKQDEPQFSQAHPPPLLDGVWQAEAAPGAVFHSTVGPGLRGAIAGTTELAWHNPETGEVGLRGYSLASLRGIHPDALAFLLLTGQRPGTDIPAEDSTWQRARTAMIEAAQLNGEVIEWLASTEPRDEPLKVLGAGLSIVACYDDVEETAEDAAAPGEPASGVLAAMRLIGHVAGLIKVHARRRMGHPLQREWEAEMSLSERLLTETRTLPPTQEHIERFNELVLAVADEGLTAGTFGGLVVASCLADWHTSLLAALPGFEGELRPREPRPCKVDARTRLLHEVLAELPASAGAPRDDREERAELFIEALRRLEVAEPLRPCLYVFARCLGLIARLREQAHDNRIYRPLARYTGPEPREVVPLDQR